MYNQGFLKVMAATPVIIAGNIENNKQNIIKTLNEAKAGIIVFPELAITGYTLSDLFYHEKTLNLAISALKEILEKNKHEGLAAIGMPLDINGGLFNVAVVIQKNKILGVIPKMFLPNNQEFSEKRWFLSGSQANFTNINLLGNNVPFGNIIFKEESKHIYVGVEICQDLWSIKSPADDLATAGANVILNLSASTELIGKADLRKTAVKDHSRKQMAGYVYTTTGIYESSAEALYSSHKIVCELGQVVKEFDEIAYDSSSIEADLNITAINYHRRQDSNYRESIFTNEYNYQTVNFNLENDELFKLSNKLNQTPFIPSSNSELERIYQILTASLVKKLSSLPKDNRKIVIGVSGGLDSTHALIIAYNAFKKLGLPLNHIYPVTMPAHSSSSKSMDEALLLIKGLNLEPVVININELVQTHLKDIKHELKDVTYENAQARIRTLNLMDLANKYNGFVLGTGDLSEIALGFMTYNGDQMSMYGINSGLPKTTIQALVKYYANNEYKHIKDLLLNIVNKKISPELLKDQDTEEIIGTYLINDFIMHYHLNEGLDDIKLEWLIKETFELSNDEAKIYVSRFLKRFYNQQFKRSTLPEGPKVFELSLSPRQSYMMPSDIVRE